MTKTLEQVHLEQLTADQLIAQPPSAPPVHPYIDVRTGPACQRVFDQNNANMAAAEVSANNAEARMKDAEARKEVLEKGRKVLLDHAAKKTGRMTFDVRAQLSKIEKELGVVNDMIAESRDKMERKRRIADNYRKLLKEFLSARPAKGFPTNLEVIEGYREEEAMQRLVDKTPGSLSGWVGV